jgi:uncharacterized protein YaaR (DUF327 family)
MRGNEQSKSCGSQNTRGQNGIQIYKNLMQQFCDAAITSAFKREIGQP